LLLWAGPIFFFFFPGTAHRPFPRIGPPSTLAPLPCSRVARPCPATRGACRRSPHPPPSTSPRGALPGPSPPSSPPRVTIERGPTPISHPPSVQNVAKRFLLAAFAISNKIRPPEAHYSSSALSSTICPSHITGALHLTVDFGWKCRLPPSSDESPPCPLL
jgi:hypothetical protein